MLYLFFQTFFWILLAFLLGLLIGWWLCGRCKCSKKETVATTRTNTVNATANPVRSNATASTTNTTTNTATNTAKAATAAAATSTVVDSGEIEVSDAWKPKGFSSRPSDADELKRVKGIGPVIEKTLNGLGIYQFKQIAEFSSDNISWVENYLSFPGRIEREDWVTQARDLAAGKETEFSKRVDKGDLNY